MHKIQFILYSKYFQLIADNNTYFCYIMFRWKRNYRAETESLIRSESNLIHIFSSTCVFAVSLSRRRFRIEIACIRGEITRRIFARGRDDSTLGDAIAIQSACCMNSSHGKPFQFLTCSCTSGFCAASRPRAPGYTLCKQSVAPGAKFLRRCRPISTSFAVAHVQPDEISLRNLLMTASCFKQIFAIWK